MLFVVLGQSVTPANLLSRPSLWHPSKTSVYYLCQGDYVFIGISSFVCLLAGLCKNYWTDYHKIRCKGGMWATDETIRYGGNSAHVMPGLGLGQGYSYS